MSGTKVQEATGQTIELNDIDHAGTIFNIHGQLITYELLCAMVEEAAGQQKRRHENNLGLLKKMGASQIRV